MSVVSINPNDYRFIPLAKLTLSPLNVRRTNPQQGIEELAELIHAQGVIQNLTVHEERKRGRKHAGACAVVAGGRRWRALRRLLQQERIKDTYPVPCRIVPYEQAVEISLAENSGRVEMHPADEFEAFQRLVDEGRSIEEIAARFGVGPLIVKRRLKLANVSPDFISLYRDGQISLDHLMALALTDDHRRQQEVWEAGGPYGRNPHALRQALTKDEVSVNTPLARFVGVDAYQQAGGVVRWDLFSEQGDGSMLDPALLNRLALEKLERHAQELRTQGLAWVDVAPRIDYAALAEYGRVPTTLREPTAEENVELDALREQQEELEATLAQADEDDEQYEALNTQADDLQQRIDAIAAACEIPDAAQEALAGAIVSVGRDGELRIERGLLKPEDAKRLSAPASTECAVPAAQPPKVHSAALTRRLTAHRTLALQATLARRPDVALIALTHRLALRAFYPYDLRASEASAVHIRGEAAQLGQHAPDLTDSKAHAALEGQRERLQTALPKESGALFGWLLERPQKEMLELLAFCVALTIDSVQSDEGTHASDALARAAALDMREWWTATAESYFTSIPKKRILDVVREVVSPDSATAMKKLNKASLAKAAEERVAGKQWLPTVLRVA